MRTRFLKSQLLELALETTQTEVNSEVNCNVFQVPKSFFSDNEKKLVSMLLCNNEYSDSQGVYSLVLSILEEEN